MRTYYTTPHRVALELQVDEFSTSTNPTKATVEMFIDEIQDFIDFYTGKSWRVVSYSTFLNNSNLTTDDNQIKIYLPHRNILSLDSSKGDVLQVWNGSTYDDYLSSKTEGRASDYYLDYKKGILYFNDSLTYKENAINITYRYSYGNTTTLSSDITDTDTTITGADFSDYPYTAVVRIDDEELYYNSKTATTITATRGVNGTTASAHSSGAEVYYCPQDIIQAATYLVCAKILKSDDRSVLLPEGTANIPIQSKEELYIRKALDILDRYQNVKLIKKV